MWIGREGLLRACLRKRERNVEALWRKRISVIMLGEMDGVSSFFSLYPELWSWSLSKFATDPRFILPLTARSALRVLGHHLGIRGDPRKQEEGDILCRAGPCLMRQDEDVLVGLAGGRLCLLVG